MSSRQVRIFQPSKTAMQSGRGKTRHWKMEYMTDDAHTPDPLMGWTTMQDTAVQIQLEFDTKEEALAYAKAKNLEAIIEEPKSAKVPPKAYAENFSFTRRRTTA